MHNVPKIPSLQYLKKRVGNKFDLLSFLQADIIVFVGSAKYISRKQLRVKLIFCEQINIKRFYNMMLSILAAVPVMPKVPKVTSLQAKPLQYLKKKFRDEIEYWC